MSDAQHAIKVVARLTGLSAHVIRIWEKRYNAVTPDRTDSQRRLYSEEQIERLKLLGEITQAGHSIGQVAQLPTARLRQMLARDRESRPERPSRSPSPQSTALEECVEAVKRLDYRGLEEALTKASLEMGSQGLIQRLVAPLAQTLGDLWRDGTITAAHEHFATSVIRNYLGHAARPFAGLEGAPILVVATPVGQLHELGALLAAATAANLGWHVTYLGASLPAAEIAGAARQNRARAVALSLVYPEDDARLPDELVRLRELLMPEVALLVGGRAMPAYADALDRIAAQQPQGLEAFSDTLDALRRPTRKGKK